jgi:hypothetical protein
MVPEKIQGFWETYAIFPQISIKESFYLLYSFNIESNNEDFPLPISPKII